MNDHHHFSGDRKAVQNSAYGLLRHLFIGIHSLSNIPNLTQIKNGILKSKRYRRLDFDVAMIFYENYRYNEAIHQFKAYLKRFPNGERKEIAECTIDICSRYSLAI